MNSPLCINSPARIEMPLLVLAALIVASFFLVEWCGAPVVAALEFRRQAIDDGEIWRLFTGNFTHFGGYHTGMNAAGWAALVAILFRYLPAFWLAVGALFVPLAVGVGLYMFAGDLGVYRGFSGANYGLLAMGLLLVLPQQHKLYGFAYCIVLGKIIYEQLPGYNVDYLQDEMGVPVAIEAHLAGFCGGTLIGGSVLLRRFLGRSASKK
jgi:rhomboid family GlyGly-CTERM serine protease